MVPKSLYRGFKEACDAEYKTVSEVLRHFMLQYTKEHKRAMSENNELTIEGQLRKNGGRKNCS